MYIVLWYRLELAIARDKGKVVNMDITQIPKSMNIIYLQLVSISSTHTRKVGISLEERVVNQLRSIRLQHLI